MKTLLIISNIICLGYLLLIHIKFPKLTSVSQSYYKWEEKKGRGVIFYFWAVLSLFTLLPVWFSVAPDNLKFIPFLSALGLGFVGAAPRFEEKHEGIVHFVSAAFCLLGSLASILIYPSKFYIFLAYYVLFIALSIRKKQFAVRYIELAAFLSIYTTLDIILL